MKKVQVCLDPVGGLGNQLFQIAAGLCYFWRMTEKEKEQKKDGSKEKERYELKLLIKKNGSSLSVFQDRPVYWSSLLKILVKDGFVIETKEFPSLFHSVYSEPELCETKIPPIQEIIQMNGNVILQGYYQNLSHLHDNFTKVVKYLLPDSFIEDAKKLSLIDEKLMDNMAFVHVRKGDYKKLPNYHPVLSMSYYERALNVFEKDVKFFLFVENEDRESTIKEFEKSEFWKGRITHVVSPSVPDYLQMLMMSSFGRGGIIANSSFSCWAAYRRCLTHSNRHKIVFPLKWFNHVQKRPDICLPYWIGKSNDPLTEDEKKSYIGQSKVSNSMK